MLRLRLLELVLEVFLVISSRKQKSLNSVAFIVNVILKLVPYQLSGHQHSQDPGKAGNGGQGGHMVTTGFWRAMFKNLQHFASIEDCEACKVEEEEWSCSCGNSTCQC